MKYLTSILVFLLQYLSNEYQILSSLYVPLYVFSTLYSYTWDITMDWGLLRGTKPGHRLLRDRLKYPKYLYYFSAITNFFLRFAWLLTLIPLSSEWETFKDT
jgi:hypothetical protein